MPNLAVGLGVAVGRTFLGGFNGRVFQVLLLGDLLLLLSCIGCHESILRNLLQEARIDILNLIGRRLMRHGAPILGC